MTLGIWPGTIHSAGTILITGTATDITAPSTGMTGGAGDGDGTIHGDLAGTIGTGGIHLIHTIPGLGAGDGTTRGITGHITAITTGMTADGTDRATTTATTAGTIPAEAASTTVTAWALPEA